MTTIYDDLKNMRVPGLHLVAKLTNELNINFLVGKWMKFRSFALRKHLVKRNGHIVKNVM